MSLSVNDAAVGTAARIPTPTHLRVAFVPRLERAPVVGIVVVQTATVPSMCRISAPEQVATRSTVARRPRLPSDSDHVAIRQLDWEQPVLTALP